MNSFEDINNIKDQKDMKFCFPRRIFFSYQNIILTDFLEFKETVEEDTFYRLQKIFDINLEQIKIEMEEKINNVNLNQFLKKKNEFNENNKIIRSENLEDNNLTQRNKNEIKIEGKFQEIDDSQRINENKNKNAQIIFIFVAIFLLLSLFILIKLFN